jgi:transposase
MKNDLLPSLSEPSIVVLDNDNASYHSRLEEKLPTCSWRKNELQTWLKKRNISFLEEYKKNTLLQLCKSNCKTPPVRAVDKIIAEAGHEVLRLPPYHCIFNPIEMVWSQAKRCYESIVLKENDPITAWKKTLLHVTPEQWSNYVTHTDNLIRKYWEKERWVTVNELVIDLSIDSDDSDSDFNFEL